MADFPERPAPAHVLVIDDDRRARSLLVRALQKIGCTAIQTAGNALKAIEEFGEKSFDMVLIDSTQGVVDPLESLRALKRGFGKQGVHYLLIQKIPDVDQTIACLKAGFHGFLTRPFHHDILHQEFSLLTGTSHGWVDSTDPGGRSSVLIADANERYRQHLAALLGREHHVHQAVTGFDALVLHRMHGPRTIILSPTVETIPFESVLTGIRAYAAAEPPRILVTLFDASEEMNRRMQQLGAAGVIKRTLDHRNAVEVLEHAGLLTPAGWTTDDD